MDTLDRQPLEPPKDLPEGLKIWDTWLRSTHQVRERHLVGRFQWAEADFSTDFSLRLSPTDTLDEAWKNVLEALIFAHNNRKEDNA